MNWSYEIGKWKEMGLNQVCAPNNGLWLEQSLRAGEALSVCDGSFQPNKTIQLGTAAWIMEGPGSTQSKGVVSNYEEGLSEYRAEFLRIYAVLYVCVDTCKTYKINHGKLRLGCNNEQAIGKYSSGVHCVPSRRNHVDILREIQEVRREIMVELGFFHVKGHQDEVVLYENLPREAQINTDCDMMAKRWLHECVENEEYRDNDILPHEQIGCIIMGKRLSS